MKPQTSEKAQGNGILAHVSSSYLRGQVHVHDRDFADFAEQHGKTEDEVINDMVNEGWTQGLDETYRNYEYWEGIK